MNKQQKWLSARYLIYKFLTNLWFLGAIWIYFYRLYITDAQIGILDGTAFAIGLIAEVPSGVLADKFGRDRMVKIGQVLAGLGLIIQGVGANFMQFIVGQAVMMIGVAFVSGADEALFFDNLKFDENSTKWRRLVTRGSQIALIGTMSALTIGGWLYHFSPRAPWILTGLSFICSIFFVWKIKDNRSKPSKKKAFSELKEHLMSIKDGFLEYADKKLSIYMPVILIVQGLFYTVGWGLLRLVLLDRFHFSPFAGSMVVASCSLITVGLLSYMHKKADSLSEKKVITSISILAAASLLLSIPNIGWWGYFIILSLYAGEHILEPFMSEVINYRTETDKRATVLSVYSFLRTLPYVVLAPIIGNLNSRNKLEYFLITWTILITVSVVIYLSNKKKDVKISLVENEPEEDRIPEINS